MSKTEFPDWAKPGEKVLAVTNRYGERDAVEGVITRLTATRIVVKFSRGESQYVKARGRGTWEAYGQRGDAWRLAAHLIHSQSEEGAGIYQELLKRSKVNAARAACEAFVRGRDVTNASAAINALLAFIATEDVTP